MPGPPKGQPLRDLNERFAEKWTAIGDCWIWTSKTNNHGYGMFYFNGRMELAHRISHLLHIGPIPAGLVIDHLCNTKACVNPDHLNATTFRANIRRAVADKSHCVNGHPLDAGNLGVHRATGWRFCRICKRACDTRRRRRLHLEEPA